MTEIEKHNHTIALFMGAILEYYSPKDRGAEKCIDGVWLDVYGGIVEGMSWWNFEPVRGIYLPPIDEWYVAEDELQYHLSWDWIMPVIQKINTPTKQWKYSIRIHSFIEVGYFEGMEWECIKRKCVDIDSLYQVVCETIKLINNDKSRV